MMPDGEDTGRREIVDASGRPARRREDRTCPKCGAPPEQRRLSGGFGEVHDICGVCGYDFEERTR